MRPLRIASLGLALGLVIVGAGCAATSPRGASPARQLARTRSAAPAESTEPAQSRRPLLAVALGDSVMTGLHCACAGPLAAYAGLMTRRAHRRVGAIDLGVDGGTTTSLLAQLRQPAVRADLRRATAIVMIVGANDLDPQRDLFRDGGCGHACFHPAVAAMGRRLQRILEAIATIRKGGRGSVLVGDYWNVFLDGDRAVADHGRAEVLWGRRISRDANETICDVVAAAGGTCVDTYQPFLTHGDDPSRYLAPDGDHPDDAGVDLIAARLAAATPAGLFSAKP